MQSRNEGSARLSYLHRSNAKAHLLQIYRPKTSMLAKRMQISLHHYIRSVSWLRWFFVTKQGEVVFAQFPNAPLWAGLGADVVAYASKGQIHKVSNGISQAAFVVWAVMEIGWGVNPFRRMLGTVVLALMGFAIYKEVA